MRVLPVILALAASAIPAAAASPAAQTGHRYLVTAFGTGSASPVVEILDESGHVQRVVAKAGHAPSLGARWSPDGSMLAWIAHNGLSVERADGSGRRLLVARSAGCKGVCTGFSFAWSPDGRSLAVGGAGLETNHLLVVSASSGESVDIAPASRFTNYFVIGWTPDGSSLVYERRSGNLGQAGCCRLDVRTAAADGRHMRVAYRFPDPFYKGSFPSLAPDGSAIAFMIPSDDGRKDLIRVVDLHSGTAHAINLGVVYDQAPAWSPDSRRLAMSRLYGQVVTVAAGGGQARTLGIRGTSVSWTRRGGIIILRGKAAGEVWASRGGSSPRLLFRLPDKLGIATIDPF
jgi:Tol biopolymer transport system component